MSLEGKVALITGAALADDGAVGIGGATAELLARRGAAVVCADVNAAGAERLAGRIASAGGTAAAIAVDLSEADAVHAMVEFTVERFAGIDILHNNAAALNVVERDLDVVNMDIDVWSYSIAVNLTAVMLACKHAIPHMVRRGGGAIVNTSSANSFLGENFHTAYGTTKAGVNALTKYVATTYGHQGVRCNAIAPGLTMSPGPRSRMKPEFLHVVARQHLGSIGEPSDQANVVAFLVSDEGAHINGQVISVDNGLIAHMPFTPDLRDLGVGSQGVDDGR